MNLYSLSCIVFILGCATKPSDRPVLVEDENYVAELHDLSKTETSKENLIINYEDIKFNDFSAGMTVEELVKNFGNPDSIYSEIWHSEGVVHELWHYGINQFSVFAENKNRYIASCTIRDPNVVIHPKIFKIGNSILNLRVYFSEEEWRRSIELGYIDFWLHYLGSPSDMGLIISTDGNYITSVRLDTAEI